MKKLKKRKRSEVIKVLESHLNSSLSYSQEQIIKWCLEQLNRHQPLEPKKQTKKSTETKSDDLAAKIRRLESDVGINYNGVSCKTGLTQQLKTFYPRVENLEDDVSRIDREACRTDRWIAAICTGLVAMGAILIGILISMS